jgi:hypothetical protein
VENLGKMLKKMIVEEKNIHPKEQQLEITIEKCKKN